MNLHTLCLQINMDVLKNMLPEEMEEVKIDSKTHFIPAAPGNGEDLLARSALYFTHTVFGTKGIVS